jgi:dehydrogenase/reductase SDR family member 7B
MSFAGQTVWITGASRGIGAALARAFAAAGARLVLSGRDHQALEAVAHTCGEALVLPFESTDQTAIPSLVEQAWSWRGGIDVLINNAGISQRSLALETAFPVYERIVAVDLLAPMALTQAVLPRMAERGAGRLVFVSSFAGKIGAPLRSAYCAAKHGLIGYADALRAETAALGLAVHVILPGSVRTDVARNALNGDGSLRGDSDDVIDKGIDPDVAAATMLAGLAAGENEIMVAEGGEARLMELRRTQPVIYDKMAGLMARGYAEQMKTRAP